MKKYYPIIYCFLLLVVCYPAISRAQVTTDSSKTGLVLSYSLKVETANRKKINISETYSGGTKTFFITASQARVRLVSLMRIESIFFTTGADSAVTVYQVKESGRTASRQKMSGAEWKKANTQYDSARTEYPDGEKTIVGILCKKIRISFADGRAINAWYTPDYPPLPAMYEPITAAAPGLVLEYQYTYKGGTLTYTAVSVKKEKINPSIFLYLGKDPASLQY